MRFPTSLAGLLVLVSALALVGCDDIFGSKGDLTTDEIFRDGANDPTLFEDVGYVPLTPFFQQGGDGGSLDRPTDVFVGYDEFVYTTDARGLHVLDLSGRPLRYIGEVGGQPLRSAGCVMQDRRLDVYVCARRDTTIGDRTWDLAVIYRLRGLTTGAPVDVRDIIWHVFDDRSRTTGASSQPRTFEGGRSDEQASFTSVAVLQNNDIYVTRTGPVNRPGSPPAGDGRPQTMAPFNSILIYTREGVNLGRVPLTAADHSIPSLRSSVYPSAVLSYFAPPQRTGLPPNLDFFVAQAPPPEAGIPDVPFGVLSINVVETSQGTEYRSDASKVSVAADPSRGDGFLYEEGKFLRPMGLARAGDGTASMFVIDAGKDSLFVFNDLGIEGVPPPPGAQNRTRPVVVSFGGRGAGPLEFNAPEGVAYYRRIVYVADTGNNRISRFRLNTDFE